MVVVLLLSAPPPPLLLIFYHHHLLLCVPANYCLLILCHCPAPAPPRAPTTGARILLPHPLPITTRTTHSTTYHLSLLCMLYITLRHEASFFPPSLFFCFFAIPAIQHFNIFFFFLNYYLLFSTSKMERSRRTFIDDLGWKIARWK